VAALGVLGLAAPAAAGASTITVAPQRACYHAGQELTVAGTGYSPGGSVRITSNGSGIGSLSANPQGAFSGALTVGLAKGEGVKTYAATDTANPALTASIALRVSALDVDVHPRSGRPGRKLRLKARGFTNSKVLYVHVVRGGHYRRTVRVGHLKGPCHTQKARKRVFARNTRSGSYIVQFDGKKKYRKKTHVRVRFRVFVFRGRRHRRHHGRASVAAARWTRLP
jgi:hypothetical protein